MSFICRVILGVGLLLQPTDGNPDMIIEGTDKSKITRKQSKTSKHGHKNLKSTKRSQRIKSEARKVKPQSNPVKENKKCHSLSLIGPIPKEECHIVERKAQVKKKIALVSLTKEAQAVTSRNDNLAILRDEIKDWRARQEGLEALPKTYK
ncbi:hypothetical protein Tco_1568996 [Tanacetum coccineum]